MKAKIFFLLSIFVLLPVFVLAEGPVPGTGTGVSEAIFTNPLSGVNSITDLLTKFLDILVQVGLVVIVFFIIFAGFQYVTAKGDTSKITKAHEALIATLIGSAIVLGSYAIATALKNTVDQLKTGTGVTQLQVMVNPKV
jgi:hypothetical protein